MRRTVTALIVTALACGALLEISFFALSAWQSRLYNQAQAESLSRHQGDSAAVQVENPYASEGESMETYLSIFILGTAAATFWTVFLLHGSKPYVSPMTPFLGGGAIGLVSLILLARMLPPNTSLERSRDA